MGMNILLLDKDLKLINDENIWDDGKHSDDWEFVTFTNSLECDWKKINEVSFVFRPKDLKKLIRMIEESNFYNKERYLNLIEYLKSDYWLELSS